MLVDDGVESQTVAPARGEVFNVDAAIAWTEVEEMEVGFLHLSRQLEICVKAKGESGVKEEYLKAPDRLSFAGTSASELPWRSSDLRLQFPRAQSAANGNIE